MTTTDVVTESIGAQAGRGLRWSLAGTIAAKVGSFAMGLAMARLLAPADFGVYAIALAALAVLMHINDVGLIAATVQWRGRLAEVAPTASTMAMAFAAIVYGLFWFSAPLFAEISGNRSATPVVRLLTLIIVIDGLTAVRSAALMRTFQQNKLIIANSVGLAANAAVAISLAAGGAGAYSFAWGQLSGAAATGVLVLLFARLPVRVGFDRAVARRLMAFGVPLALSLGVEAVVTNVQFTIIGRQVGSAPLGYYLLAFNVSIWAQTVLGTAIRYVSVAGFSRLSEHADEALSVGVRRSMPLLVMVVAPIATLTAVLAPQLVSLLYGGAWAPAAPVLRVLAVVTLARMMIALAGRRADGRGRDQGEPVAEHRLGCRAGTHALVRHRHRRHPWRGPRAGRGRVPGGDSARRAGAAPGWGPPGTDRARPGPAAGRGAAVRRRRGDGGPARGGRLAHPARRGRHRGHRGLPGDRCASGDAAPVARGGAPAGRGPGR